MKIVLHPGLLGSFNSSQVLRWKHEPCSPSPGETPPSPPSGERGRVMGRFMESHSVCPRQRLDASALQPAFTLIEMILAIGVAAIVLITVSTVFFAAIRLRDETQNVVDNAKPADLAMATMRRDLECVVTPTNGTTKVLSGDFRVGDITSSGNNEPVAIEMFTATGQLGDQEPWGDIQRVTYELRNPVNRNIPGKDLFRSITRNLLSPTTPQVEDQWMMSGVQTLAISCYDGVQWWNTWDTTGLTSDNTNLPVAVRVDIQPVGNQLSPIEMVVPIDSQSRSNATLSVND